MAVVVGSSLSNISSARAAQRSISTSSSARASNLGIPQSAKANRFSSPRIVVNAQDARTLLSVSVVSAVAIVEALKHLMDAAKLATHDSLVDTATNLTTGGDTRVSRLNINVGVNQTIDRINKLIESAEFGNVNLLSSKSHDFYLQTTDYGGKIAVQPQPLDSAGLGLDDLNLVFETGANRGFSALSEAYVTASKRLSTIRQLREVLNGGSALDQSLQTLISQFQNSTLPAGSFVDLKA